MIKPQRYPGGNLAINLKSTVFAIIQIIHDCPKHHALGVITMVTNQSANRAQSHPLAWQLQVEAWRLQACNHRPGSQERNYYLTQIIRVIAPKLWRVNTPYYADALQQTWTYFVDHICTQYDPSRASISTWLNVYLRYRHQDLVQWAAEEQRNHICLDPQMPETADHPAQVIRDVASKDYGSSEWLEQVIHWVETDADGILRQTHVRGRPDINCQTILLLRLPPVTPWRAIATRFNQKVPTLAGFYQRQCLPRLRQFGQTAGLLD
jgi:hypothetical protein